MTLTAMQETEDPRVRQINWRLWMRILSRLRPYPGPSRTMIGSGLLIAAIDTTLPLLTAGIIDSVTGEGARASTRTYALTYVALLFVFAFLVWWFIRAAGRLATGVAYDLRSQSFSRLQELPFSYFDVRSTGWLVARVTSDIRKVTDFLPWLLLDFAWGFTMIIGIVTAMLIVNVTLGLAVITIIPPLALATWWFKRRMLESSRKMRRANSSITAGYTEMIQGVRTTRMLVREEGNLGEFQSITSEMHEWSIRNALQSAVYLPIVMSLGAVGVGIALWQGGLRVQAETGLTLGILIAFMQYAVLFSEPIQEIAQRFVDLQSAQAAAERVMELLDEEPQIADSPAVREAIASQKEAPVSGRAADGGEPKINELAFQHVSHEYTPGETVLDEISFQAQRGMTIALVGPTGGGKSTIVSLLARWYEPTSGRILVNGVDYSLRGLDWWQSQFGVVQQVPHLFSGSVRDNVRYGRLDASDQEIISALDRVGAEEFVLALQGSLDFEVGEGGQRLSTGERQLISLARAVLADPQDLHHG